jgi:hypothetical protein
MAQGLPPTVEDPAVIAQVVAIIGDVTRLQDRVS